MRRTLLVLATALALPPAALRGDTPPGGDPAARDETTEVRGDVPEWLVGRWLLVGVVDVAQPVRLVRLLEVRKGSQHPELRLGPSRLPPEIQARMTAAPAGTPWAPSASDLAELDRRWESLHAADPGRAAQARHEIVAASDYPDDVRADPRFADVPLAIVNRETFSGGRVATTVSIWGVRDTAADVLAGPFGILSVASAPFPIPISLKGTYQGHRVGDDRGLLAGFLDLFSGCGRE